MSIVRFIAYYSVILRERSEHFKRSPPLHSDYPYTYRNGKHLSLCGNQILSGSGNIVLNQFTDLGQCCRYRLGDELPPATGVCHFVLWRLILNAIVQERFKSLEVYFLAASLAAFKSLATVWSNATTSAKPKPLIVSCISFNNASKSASLLANTIFHEFSTMIDLH